MDAASVLSGASATSGAADRFSTMDSQDFLKIILSELERQDPLDPNDTSALLEQLSMIRSIQSDLDLGKDLSALADREGLTAGSQLIGLRVSGVAEGNRRVDGVVAKATQSADGVTLTLEDGVTVPLDEIDEVSAVDSDAGGEE